MKKVVIDSDNYIREIFKTTNEPLNTIIKNENPLTI